MNTNSFVLG